jgi:hypothetical protein
MTSPRFAEVPTRAFFLLMLAFLSSLPARADNIDAKPVAPEQFKIPAREKEFITIFTEARRQFASETRTAKREADQILLEQRIGAFMRRGQDVRDWVGVVRNHGMADKTHSWVEIEIAPDLVLSTLRNMSQDQDYQTLIPQYSPMSTVLNHDILMGQAVIFDASMLIFDVPDDRNAVERSKFIARFWKLRPIADNPQH